MGKKSHVMREKGKQKAGEDTSSMQPTGSKKLSPQKRNEVNQLIERILKGYNNGLLHVVSSSVPLNAAVSKEWEAYEEIEKLLSKVKHFEKDIDTPNPPRSAALNDFLTWLNNNGAVMDGLNIMEFPDMEFGILAERDFNQGDLMIAVPRRLMLTVERIQDSVLGTLATTDPLLQHMPNVSLALLLLVECHSIHSFWHPYIRMLPEKYSTVLNFSSEEMQQLKGSPALDLSLKQCRNIARQYAYFNRIFQNGSDPASQLLCNVFTYKKYW